MDLEGRIAQSIHRDCFGIRRSHSQPFVSMLRGKIFCPFEGLVHGVFASGAGVNRSAELPRGVARWRPDVTIYRFRITCLEGPCSLQHCGELWEPNRPFSLGSIQVPSSIRLPADAIPIRRPIPLEIRRTRSRGERCCFPAPITANSCSGSRCNSCQTVPTKR